MGTKGEKMLRSWWKRGKVTEDPGLSGCVRGLVLKTQKEKWF
jgi:hypothetical protein